MDAKPLSFILRLWPHRDGCRYEVRCVKGEESCCFEQIEDLLHYLKALTPEGQKEET